MAAALSNNDTHTMQATPIIVAEATLRDLDMVAPLK
jgi:hypothetical protein